MDYDLTDVPTVSVVIPVFNRPEELAAAISTVILQTYPVHEIIVVDDASHPPIDADSFTAMDPRVRVLVHSVNKGGAGSRNSGIDAATGNWIAFLDSDDLWLPKKIETQMAAIKLMEGNHDNIACGSNFLLREPAQADRPFNKNPLRTGELADWILLQDNTLQTSNLMVRTSLARRVRFNEQLRRHEDWDFVLQLEQLGAKILYIEECLSVWVSSSRADRLSRTDDVSAFFRWTDVSNCTIPSRIMLGHYIHHIFYKHRRQSFTVAVRRLISLALASPGGWRMVIDHFSRRAQARWQGK